MSHFRPTELREAFRNVPMITFMAIYDAFRGDDQVLDVLDKADMEARATNEAIALRIKKHGELLSASEQHRVLRLEVPTGVHLESAQAILMYGFLMPGKGRLNIGSNALPRTHVRRYVENKLGNSFELGKFDAAFDYFIRESIFNSYASSGNERVYSLKSGGTEPEMSDQAKFNLRAALDFARSKKR